MGSCGDQGTKSRAERLKALALEQGFDRAGVAVSLRPEAWLAYQAWLSAGLHGSLGYMAARSEERRGLEAILPGARSVLMVALGYAQPPEVRPGWPRVARYALGRDYHRVVRSRLRRVAARASEEFPGERFRPFVDSAPVLERAWAQAAGLGWFGKNTCLIDSRFGSWFLIGGLATTLELEPDVPTEGGCGTCARCIEACPTGAIVRLGERWAVDAARCVSTLTIELRRPFEPWEEEAVGDWTFGCDVCQEVCPFNQPRSSQPERARTTAVPDFLSVRRWPSLEEILAWTREQWDEATRGSPVRRAGYEGLLRNAKANLRNLRAEDAGRQNGADG
ncbi:MAG: tRNA epoxyqueuosine(34) reductase QueG [Armatimonadetes bacterium]|nr:tRNA epoxyqueuosine(34) reductase QueG [Armatimonadota bacterium]